MTDESIKVTQIQSFSFHLQAFNTEYSTCDTKFSPESNKDRVLTAITTGHREEPQFDHPQTVIWHEIFSRADICRVCKDPKKIVSDVVLGFALWWFC